MAIYIYITCRTHSVMVFTSYKLPAIMFSKLQPWILDGRHFLTINGPFLQI